MAAVSLVTSALCFVIISFSTEFWLILSVSTIFNDIGPTQTTTLKLNVYHQTNLSLKMKEKLPANKCVKVRNIYTLESPDIIIII